MPELILNIVLPIILSGMVTLVTLWYQDRRKKPQQRVEILNLMEDISGGLAEQLRQSYAEIRELRAGIHILIRGYTERGLTVPWRPNGTTLPKSER